MSKNAVVTVLIGARHQNIADVSHPTQIDYAHRNGLDYVVYNSETYLVLHPDGSQSTLASESPVIRPDDHTLDRPAFGAYNKLNIYELLDHYDRILYVDTDILIRNDAPNLFEIVPENLVAMLSETDFFPDYDDRVRLMNEWADKYNIDLSSWDGQYYNSGVMLLGKHHRKLLSQTDGFYDDAFFEQTAINMNIHKFKIPIFKLDYKFNRMSFMDRSLLEPRHSSYFIHYAGSWMMLKEGHSETADYLITLMQYDLEKWKNNSKHDYGKIENYFPRGFWVRD